MDSEYVLRRGTILRGLSMRDMAARIGARKMMLRDVAMTFVLSQLIFFIVAAVAIRVVPEHHGLSYEVPAHSSAPPLIDVGRRWDAFWYEEIALHGYSVRAGQSSVAFFPLYPLLLRAGLTVFPHRADVVLVEAALSRLLLFAGLAVIYLYAERQAGPAVARRTLFFLTLFPTAFFFSAAYSESLFLLLTAAVFLWLQSRRFGLAGVSGLCASLARPTGVFLVLPYGVEWWRRRDRDPAKALDHLLPILLIPAGIALYALFLGLKFGDPLIFNKAQGGWGRVPIFPLKPLIISLTMVLRLPSMIVFSQADGVFLLMNFVNTVAVIWALIVSIRMLRSDLPGSSFALPSLVSFLSTAVVTTPVVSAARYVAVLFPVFLSLARWADSRQKQVVVAAAFLPLQCLLLALFVRWYWVV